ncbi:MAG: hypothetical protein ACTHPS_11590 [Streptosporangiaceae bacterium]
MEINEASRWHTISEEARAAVAEADAVIREARRRQRRRQFRTGAVAVLELACAVAGYAMAAGDGSRPPARTVTGAGQQRAGGPATARAAQRAAGRYWVTSGTVGNVLKVGPAGDPYLVLEEVGVQSWAARSPREGSPYLAQALWVRPASPSDQAAWRRDGSPTEWKQIGQDTALADPYGVPGDARVLPLSAAPGKLTPGWANYGSQPFLVGDKALSLRQLLALPADPARLKELLLQGSSHYPQVSQSAYLLQAVPPVLQMPVTPAVRSALYRMLAAMPGIQNLGTVKDVSGKHGAAVAYAGRYANCGNGMSRTAASRVLFTSCTVQQILVIDPATGLPQAEELRYAQLPPGQKWPAPSGLFSYEIFGRSHWTNHNRPRV